MINSIIKKIEDFAPIETAKEWDNPGRQINLGIKETKKVMLVLDITLDIIEQAAKAGCDLIISHHPLFFNTVKRIDNPIVIKAVQNNIQIYSAHTNLDIAKGGMTDYLADKCGFTELETVFDFVKYKTFENEQSFGALISKLKRVFALSALKITNPNRETYKSIAFCSGSGAEFILGLEKMNIDVYITGDIKHHQALEAQKLTIIDLGHFQTEKFAAEIFKNILKDENIEIIEAVEKPAWEYV